MSSGPLSLENRMSVLSASPSSPRPCSSRPICASRSVTDAEKISAARMVRKAASTGTQTGVGGELLVGRVECGMRDKGPKLDVERLPAVGSNELQRFVDKLLGGFGPIEGIVGWAVGAALFGAADEIEAVFVRRRAARVASQVPFADVGRGVARTLRERGRYSAPQDRGTGSFRGPCFARASHSAREFDGEPDIAP